MTETEAYQLVADFKDRIKTNRGITLALNGKEIRLTRYKGNPPGIKSKYFAVISWPKGTYSGFMGYKGVMDASGTIVFDTVTSDKEVHLLVATESIQGLESIFERIFFAGDIEIVPGALSGWVMRPGGSFGQYPILETADLKD